MRVYILSFLLILITLFPLSALELKFNNGSEKEYEDAANLNGTNRFIQENTKGLWPRKSDGQKYDAGENKLSIRENDEFIIIETNNLPDHEYHTNNPNCAKKQNFKFLIPKTPEILKIPKPITKKMQVIGVALNGVVIAGPYDSRNKIAPYNRKIDQCSAHADPEGMYHYHFSPLCLKEKIALNPLKQIGWSFDGFKIFGLADRDNHLPLMDSLTNGHEHDDEFHYHATIDFPFFIGAYKAQPQLSNFDQKIRGRSNCPSSLKRKKGKKPNFRKAEKILGVSISEIKKALGPPPGNFNRAAKKLGLSVRELKRALDK